MEAVPDSHPKRDAGIALERLSSLTRAVHSAPDIRPDTRALMAKLLTVALSYETQHRDSIRLVPTEGIQSPAALTLMATVMNGRYLHAPAENNAKAIRYPDIAQLQEVHAICCAALRRVLNAEHVNVDCLSGLHVMQMALLAFAAPGELVLSISPDDGGHELMSKMAKALGRQVAYLPFDRERHVIDAAHLDRSKKPALVYVDHSNVLRPHDLRAIKASYPDSVVLFDISQVFASVAGGIFPNPLESGADAVVGSTHKSLNGPQKAVFAANRRDLADRFAETAGVFISNNHPGDVAALAMTLLEFLAFGPEYAHQMVANANALADAFLAEGLPLYDQRTDKTGPYTLSPHVWLDCEKCGWRAEQAAQHLFQHTGIVVNTLYLARGGADSAGAKGLRLGTTEVTRIGMKEEDMRLIAKLIAMALAPDAGLERIREAVLHLRHGFTQVEYCLHI